MPVIAEQRKNLEDYLAGIDGYEYENFVNIFFETVTVGGSETDVDPIGTPLIYVAANTRFEVYENQDIAAAITAGGSPLPGGAVIAVSVGDRFGKGFSEADINLTEGAVPMTVHYNGPANVLDGGIDWRTSSVANQQAFRDQLFVQKIKVDTAATRIEPTNLV